ncbi:hypothetical protein SAMN04488118_105229 [Epibacterium ulvae]|uniref:Transcriptional activator HlyU n=1 Tax=Epibacterium ulvae TaxID=1156985 RepID=A0A1G5QTE8_9RHOB|nr:HlyU family transcriptional regulator [Epibacterium ulvae]SCZ64359.1 hypothetical protein SAMN04488118_105229 [Epibacterium ulvae]
MSLFSKLFGGGAKAKSEPTAETYEGFQIFVEPQKSGQGYCVGARVEKEINGELKSHMMIRADNFQAKETADEVSLLKAKKLIDEQGDSIFR